MNTLRIEEAVNYRKPLGILIGALVLTVLATLGILLGPVRKHALKLKAQEATTLAELQGRPSPSELNLQLEDAEKRHEAMAQAQRQWKDWVNTLGEKPSRFSGDTEEDLRIDYKVALFNSRARLKSQAALKNVILPNDLGMPETIDAGEAAVVRLWQLEAVEKLLAKCIELGLPSVESIETLPTLSRSEANQDAYPHHEFPVRIVATAFPDQTAALLEALQQKGSFFALRRFSAERDLTDMGDETLLKVSLIAGAKLFQPLISSATQAAETGTENDKEDDAFDVLSL